jgi:hypothetical protein
VSYNFDRDNVALKNCVKDFVYQLHERRTRLKMMRLKTTEVADILKDIKKPNDDS